jgi:hypothetical protein
LDAQQPGCQAPPTSLQAPLEPTLETLGTLSFFGRHVDLTRPDHDDRTMDSPKSTRRRPLQPGLTSFPVPLAPHMGQDTLRKALPLFLKCARSMPSAFGTVHAPRRSTRLHHGRRAPADGGSIKPLPHRHEVRLSGGPSGYAASLATPIRLEPELVTA